MLRAAGLVLLACLTWGCSDAKEVNAAFSQTRVTWWVFDTGRIDGLRALPGFEQAQRVVWAPRTHAVRATDMAEAPGTSGAVAVSRMGLLLLDDSTGTLAATRPGAQLPLTEYQTGRMFVWQKKLFVTLSQEAPAVLPPATLAWWSPGQTRLAFYPVPSQIKDPSRQVIGVIPPAEGTSNVTLEWKTPRTEGWSYERSSFSLDGGIEASATSSVPDASPLAPDYGVLKARLAERVGLNVPVHRALGTGPLALYTDAGWVAVGRIAEKRARLYKLPDLGVAGRYTGALAMTKGFVFSWEVGERGYVGAGGLIYVPFAVLAP